MKLTRWRKLTGLTLILAITGMAGVACDDDEGNGGPTGPTIADLAGSWQASATESGTSFVLTWNTDPNQVVSMVDLGATVTLTVLDDGTFTIVVDFPDAAPFADITLPGEFEIMGNNVMVTTPVGSVEGTISLDGDTLTLVLMDVSLVDFDGDQVSPGDPDDDARLDATVNRVAG